MSSRLWVSTDKAPYVVTLLVAALAWTVNRSVTVLTESPTIAYKVDHKPHDDRAVICHIRNVSRTRQFRELQFLLTTDSSAETLEKARFVDQSAHILAVSPAFSLATASITTGRDMATFDVPLLQPGWALDLEATLEQRMPIGVQQRFVENAKDQEAVRMVSMGIETWIVEHETNTLFILIGVWLLGLVIWSACASGR